MEIKSQELINKSKERMESNRIEKYSKKLRLCNTKLRNKTKETTKQLRININFIKRPLSSFKKRKVEKKPSIFKFNKSKKTQSKIKKVCQKISLLNNGKLKLKLFTKRALNINCSKIDNERNNSGKKDFKIRKSINKLYIKYIRYPLWELNPYLCRERVMSEPLDEEDFFSTKTCT